MLQFVGSAWVRQARPPKPSESGKNFDVLANADNANLHTATIVTV